MNYETVLNQLQDNELSVEQAYKKIYKEPKIKPGKRAFFLKVNITVPDESAKINTFLRILFLLPIPLVFARLGLRIGSRFIKDDLDGFNVNEIIKLIKYSKNTKVQVDAKDAKIDIRII